VVNLIHNGVDAMPDGGRLCLRGEIEGESAIVTCQDSGLGMSPDVLNRIFEPFFTTKGAHGTGLGLAIVKSVMGRHGGDAYVTSEGGIGTTVTLRLPAANRWPGGRRGGAGLPRASSVGPPSHGSLGFSSMPGTRLPGTGGANGFAVTHSHARMGGPIVTWDGLPARRATDRGRSAMPSWEAARAAAADDLAATLATLTVLVVEDDPIFRAVFSRRLGLDARRVDAVEDAASALAALEAGCWDVLCVDDGLPDRTGRALVAEIRQRGLRCAVVLVTGTATGPDDPSLAAPGVDAVLPKPCTDAELARALRVARARQGERAGRLA